MRITQVGTVSGGQDGAIFGRELFRLNHRGECRVFDLSALRVGEITSLKPTALFMLDRAEEIVPHSNAVFFGTERFAEGDEYPILYSNMYNNRASYPDRMLGVLCAYRLEREGSGYKTTLVQLIKIGFCEDATLWRASEEGHGVRPYGNFQMDTKTGDLYAFVMRNEALGTRYFRLRTPSVHEGEVGDFGVRCAALYPEDIRAQFDGPYCHFIQGAALRDGILYSTEGFDSDERNHPAIRAVSLDGTGERYFDLLPLGYTAEPEMIDFYEGIPYYSDAHGRLYTIEF